MKMGGPDVFKNKRQLDKMNLKGMVWRLVKEIFSPTNMEEVKRKLDGGIGEVIYAIQRDKETTGASNSRRKEDEEQRMEERDELPGVFWEEDLVLLMLQDHLPFLVNMRSNAMGLGEPTLQWPRISA